MRVRRIAQFNSVWFLIFPRPALAQCSLLATDGSPAHHDATHFSRRALERH